MGITVTLAPMTILKIIIRLLTFSLVIHVLFELEWTTPKNASSSSADILLIKVLVSPTHGLVMSFDVAFVPSCLICWMRCCPFLHLKQVLLL